MSTVPAAAVEQLLKSTLRQPRPWDGPPELCLIYRHTFGFALVEMSVPEIVWEMTGHPYHAMRAMTRLAEEDPELTNLALSMCRVPGGGMMIGLALLYEAWMGANLSSEQAAMIDQGKLKVADIPGSLETRNVSAVDVEGKHYLVTLKRGQSELQSNVTGTDGFQEQGRVPEAMETLLQAFLRLQSRSFS
jgi:hypothetical protein